MATTTQLDRTQAEEIINNNWSTVSRQIEAKQGSWGQKIVNILDPLITITEKDPWGLPAKKTFSCRITASRPNHAPANIPAGKERAITATSYIEVSLDA